MTALSEMTGLGAWWDGLYMSKADKEVALQGFLADVGDFRRLSQIVHVEAVSKLGVEHPLTVQAWKTMDRLIELSKTISPAINKAISELVRKGEWPFDTLTFEDEYAADDSAMRPSGTLGAWVIPLAVVLISPLLTLAVFVGIAEYHKTTILAKAQATAILREIEARAKAIEEGKGDTLPAGGPLDSTKSEIGWKGVVLAGVALVAAAIVIPRVVTR